MTRLVMVEVKVVTVSSWKRALAVVAPTFDDVIGIAYKIIVNPIARPFAAVWNTWV